MKKLWLTFPSTALFLFATLACSTKLADLGDSAESSLMEYVEIGNGKGETKRFSRLVMGTDHLDQGNWVAEGQKEPTEEETFRVLDEAAKHGINLFDTSPIYVGGVEQRLGKWRESRSAQTSRDAFYLSPLLNPDRKIYALSKGGFPFDLFWAKRLEPGTHSEELKRELYRRGALDPNAVPAADGSLPLKDVPPGTYASRLFGDAGQITSRVEEEDRHTNANLHGDLTIYLMHRDDGDAVGFDAVERAQTPVRTILQGVSCCRLKNQYWALGWSNWRTPRVNESVALARENARFAKPVINSPYFSLFEMSSRTIHAIGVQVTHREMMDPKFQEGIKIMPYSPLGGFSILDKPEPQWENAKRAAKEKYDKRDPYWQNVYPSIFTPENEARWYRVVEFTKQFNAKHGTRYTVDQMINAYALAHPRTDLLAVGALTVEQVRRTVASLRLSKLLTPDDLEFLHSGARR